ncbi:MAG: helix-turn-helix transcriptional regulator [Deltaproteobacteria bacterium]|nr:helix-turn-helix transcriptional regulator [Deltaproteobacteria bacterium]
MGNQVEGVPDRPAVDAPPAFGHWYRTQRELRGVAAEYVAERTKLAPERISDIECGARRLPANGTGRLTARALAQAIGADGDEAVRVLVESGEPVVAVARLSLRRIAAVAARLALALALVAAVWMLGAWLVGLRGPDEPPRIVHRPDYVQRALESAP